MYIEKSEAVKILNKNIGKNIGNKSHIMAYFKKLMEMYNMSNELAYGLVSSPVDFDISEDKLFCLYNVVLPNRVSSTFTPLEISQYVDLDFSAPKVEFPIVLNMQQISDDHWIGSIDVKTLMSFRDADLIRYNEKTQRTMKRVSQNGEETYVIAINQNQVREIEKSFRTGNYIPDTITLNLPPDAEFDYTDGQIVITKLQAFDIIDGYHRYLAMSHLHNVDPDFNYQMELRLVFFNETKARQFIWQADQKTKMTKVDSNSMNQSDAANQIVSMLNQSGPLKGKLEINSLTVSPSMMAEAIRNIYFFNKNKQSPRSEIIRIRNSINDYLNMIDEKKLNSKWEFNYIILFIACCYYDKIDLIDEIYERKILSDDSINCNAKGYKLRIRYISALVKDYV